MFCPKCGTQLPDGAKFCGKCGAQIGAAAASNPAPTASGVPTTSGVPVRTPSGKSNKTKWIILAAALVVVIAVVVILIVTLGGGSDGGSGGAKSFETVIEQYFDALEADKVKTMVKLYPEQLYELYEDLQGGDEDDFLNGMDDYYNLYGAEVEDWEILGSEYVDDEELEEGAEMLEALDMKIKKAVEVEVYAEFDDDGEPYDTYMLFRIVQMGSKWYLFGVTWDN